MTQDNDAHSRHSVLRETIVEHLFVAAVLQRFWQLGIYDAEVLRSEYDGHGYDLVLSRGKTTRHIQLKSGVQSRPGRRSVNGAIAKKDGGCVLWLGLDSNLNLKSFWIFDDFDDDVWVKAKAGRGGYVAEGPRRVRAGIVVLKTMEQLANLDELLGRLLKQDFARSD